MNMNQIKYFVSVFELGSFSRASQQCSVTVQAISKSINDLEKELELSLFTRASNGVVPTIYGKGFYEKARLTLASFQDLEAFAHNKTVLEKEAPFCIALCAPEFNYYQEFCASIATFIAKNISFNVKINVIDPGHAQHTLECGCVDALITIGAYEHKKVSCTPLGALPTGIIVSPDHPLAVKGVVAEEDLSAYPAAYSPTYDGFNESIMIKYRNKKLLGDICLIEDQNEIPDFLEKKHGYYFSAIVPQPKELRPHTRLLPIDPSCVLNIPICFVTLKNDKSTRKSQIETFLLNAIDAINNKGEGLLHHNALG